MASSKLRSRGRITLPREVRNLLRLQEGDRVDFVIDDHGHVRLQPARCRVADLFGMLHVPGQRALTIEAMDEAIDGVHGRR